MDTEGMSSEVMRAAKARAAKLRANTAMVHAKAGEHSAETTGSERNVTSATIMTRARHEAALEAKAKEMRSRGRGEVGAMKSVANDEVGFVKGDARGAAGALKDSARSSIDDLIGARHVDGETTRNDVRYRDMDAEMRRISGHVGQHTKHMGKHYVPKSGFSAPFAGGLFKSRIPDGLSAPYGTRIARTRPPAEMPPVKPPKKLPSKLPDMGGLITGPPKMGIKVKPPVKMTKRSVVNSPLPIARLKKKKPGFDDLLGGGFNMKF
jgi:hypothetical protein